MHKTFKYRIYPTKKQTNKLNYFLDLYRWVYNRLLEQRKTLYESEKKQVSLYVQTSYIKNVLTTEKPELKEIHAQSLQNIAKRIDRAFNAFFRRVKAKENPGYPRFKGKNQYDSFTYPQNNGAFKFVDGKLRLSKVGHVKVKQHRLLQGTPKTCTVKRTSTGKWFVTIVCENIVQEKLSPTDTQVGIDLGISSFATFDTGEKINNPRFFKAEEKALAKSQRKKKKKVTARVHERISNKRSDFLHKLSKRIIGIYGTICIEDLSINRMIKSGKANCLSKSIQDVSWGMFTSILSNKAENAGRTLIKVNPAYTSQDCSCCLASQKIDLSVRVYECNFCGLKIDRDVNAARNILTMGLHSLAKLNKLNLDAPTLVVRE